MESKLFVLWLLPSLLFRLSICIDQASFYGTSYISLPFQEAKSSTDIHFQFRTLLPNALLLLVAGTTDYCIVRLENGRIKISINLGAGESELFSQHNLKLNDFKWHDVKIVRKEANLSMQIDNAQSVQKQLPGQFFELNIHYGLFVGGHGNFSEIFFGHLDNFRGCLSDLSYNGVSVLEQARLRQLQSLVQRITWNCANEFEATFEHPISFVEDDAFMLLSHPFRSKDVKLQFDVKTQSKQGVLFYNTGRGAKFDYFLIEIWKGNIRCLIKSDAKSTELVNSEYVADGHWHKIHIHIGTLIEITVDGKLRNEKNPHGHLQLNDNMYIGGLEVNKRSRAMSRSCKFCDVSFKGCMRHIVISDSKIGLSDVSISEGLLPGCVWQYPCLQNPCKDGAVCVQQGLDSFQCYCQDEFCLKMNFTESYKVFSHNSLATELELLSVEPLSVLEGQSTIITTKNLHMILDYQKFGIRDSGILFHIVESPIHGTVNVWPHEKTSFSLADVLKDKIHYIHDGSEFHQDIMVLEVEFSPDKTFLLPAYLQGRFRFSLSANIVPVNDLPQFVSSESTVLRIVEGTKKVIDSELFKVNDPDSSPEQIIYNVIKSDIGHFEHKNKEGIKINSFTQKEIQEEKVVFVHHSNSANNESTISLQISDGIETSPITKIRVSVSRQYWRLENNTGLSVLHQTTAVITPFNLSFTSNVVGVDHKIQFHIVKRPSYGIIEVEKNINVWEASEIFTNIDLKQHRVRYRHTTAKPEFDEFQFRLTLDKSSLYTFRLTFVKCSLLNMNTKPLLQLNESWEATISSEYLSFHTQPIKTLATSVHYVITSPPVYGYLFSALSKYKLRSCDTFTQEDIQSQNIKYRFHQKPFSFVNDSFQFVVLSPGCKNVTHTFTITYKPPDEVAAKVSFYFKPLLLDEGSTEIIDAKLLSLKTSQASNLVFNITQKPRHGFLSVKNVELARNDTHFFTLTELKSEQVRYTHDGSETRQDNFVFCALSINEDFQYVGEYKIEVNLKNDNSPNRAVEKVFHVVVGGERLLTQDDLNYSDADLDTTPGDIVYTCRESPNGNFYHLGNRTLKIKEFTQDDINKKQILFRHKGPEYAKVRLWVTDGHFHVSGILEVQASAPFIHVHHRKKLVVQQSSFAVVTEENLSYSTNVFAADSDVMYEVTSQPTSGRLVTSTLTSLENFTQEDITSGQVRYINEASNSDADEIELTVRCRDAVSVAQLSILILPSTYWEPLEVKSVNKLTVEESTSAIITKNILEISQLNVPPSAINYYVTTPPENGYISVITDSKRSDYEPNNVCCFTQDLINDNRVLYIQSVANQTRDKIVFNVTNGMVWQNDIIFRIEIIPEQIYLSSNNLTVNEGGIATISTSHIFVMSEYYKTKNQLQNMQFVILQDAQHGCLQIDKRCSKVNKFSHKKLLGGAISYAHDGSEELADEIKISAVVNQKRSNPITLYVNVLPVNDQKPKVVNITGMLMWAGGVQSITKNMLAAVDDDKPGDTLKYQVIRTWACSLSLKSDLSTPVNYFTQELIDKEMIVFHSEEDGRPAKFTFNVSDGLHTTQEYSFYVNTQPVELRLHTKPLHIFPLQRKYITPAHLLATVSDPNRTVTFDIITPPSLGRLMMESDETKGIYKVVSTFTQHQLNNSRIFYEHTHQFSDLYANDSFVFNVKSHLARTLHNEMLKIDISVSSGGLDAYVSIPKISVDEGGITTISLNFSKVISFLENHAGIRSPIIHAAASSPQHGLIFLHHNRNITTFTQQQLESGQVYYEHDHSDSLGDNIHFALYLLPGYVSLCNITVPVTIEPINDQPFHLITPVPSLTVVQGENHTITRAELATEDADTPPNKIKYVVINSGPTEGKLLLLPERVPVMYFTQADIDNGLLVYTHNSSVLKDSFHFRVWDEQFPPQFRLFNIVVLPIHINISAGLPVYLQQGSDVVFLSEKQFFIDTNANKNKIRYTVKREPKRGVLYVQDTPSMIFTQNDLHNDYVMYLQTDMTAANDTFRVMGEIISGNTSVGNEVDVIIKVQPLMQIRNFTVATGEYNRITLSVLDATPLAKLTNSNPRYTITHTPASIQIRKVIRSSGEKRNVLNTVITSFSHEEIQSGLIYLYVKNIELPWNELQERVGFILASSIFQPAVGELRVDIRSSISNDIHSTLAGPSDPAGHEGGLHFASPNMTRDYFLIVSMVAGVVILGVAVIVVIKCRALEVEELKKEEEALQTLPRPPDRLLSSPSPLKPPHLDGFTPPLPAALPQCKVTPLSRSEVESNACYPYGVDEQHSDDWSSCEASDPMCPSKNIMLRRNQYWV